MTEPAPDPLAALRPFVGRGDPFPLAWILQTKVLGQSDPEKQASALVEFARATVRYAALVAASDYAHRPVVEARVSRALEGLARPTDSTFGDVLRAAVPVLAARGGLFVPELVASLDQAQQERVSVLRMGERGLEAAEPQPLLVAVVQMRNAKVHERFAGYWPGFVAHTAPLVAKLLSAFPWFPRYGLMRLVGAHEWIRLAGPAPVFEAQSMPAAARASLAGAEPARRLTGLCLVSPEGDRVLPLDPFVIWADCPVCREDPMLGLGAEVFVFNGDEGRSVAYAGMVHARRLSPPWTRMTEIFRAKHVPAAPLAVSELSVPDLCQRAARQSAIGLAENVAAQRYLPGLYQARAEPEDELERYLAGDRAAFLLAGEAGSGKTSLLCHAVETWKERGEIVLLYQGHQLRPDEPLEDRAGRDLHLAAAWPAVVAFLARQGSRLVIVVDGLNESGTAAVLLRELCAFAARVALAPGAGPPTVKLVLSVRSTSFARALATLLAAGGDEGALFPAGVFHQGTRGDAWLGTRGAGLAGARSADQAYRIALGRLTPDEVEGLYESHRAAPEDLGAGGAGRRRCPLTPFVGLSPAVREILAHPWYLRLVLETYDGQPVPPDLWGGALVEQFCRARVVGRTADEAARFAGRAALLDELVALMRRHRVAAFRRDDLHDLSPRWSQALLDPDLARSPYLQLVDEGVLMEAAETDTAGQWPRTRHTVRVAFDALLDHLLADAVLREAGGTARLAPVHLTGCLEESRGFEPMAGAVEVLLAGAARAGRQALLRETFDAASPDLAGPAYLRVIQALEPGGAPPFETLLEALALSSPGTAGRGVMNDAAVEFLTTRRFRAALACTQRVALMTPGSTHAGTDTGPVIAAITPAAPPAGAIAAIHQLAVALANQGVAESGLGESRAASVSYGHALRLFGRLVEDEGRTEYQGDLAHVIMLCGNSLVDLGQLDEALGLLENAVGHAKRAVASAERAPDATRGFHEVRVLALAALNRGLLLERLGQHQRAAADCDIAARMVRVGVNGGVPGDWAHLLGQALAGQSTALASLGRLEEALAIAEEAVAIQRRRLEAERGTAGAEDLATALRVLSLHLDRAGRSVDALAALDQGIGILRRLVESGRSELGRKLGGGLSKQAALLQRIGRHAEGQAAADEAAAWRAR